jgi:hypothetical protein
MYSDPDFDAVVENCFHNAVRGEKIKTFDLTIKRKNASSSWVTSDLTRAELLFVDQRIREFLKDTNHDENIVYTMDCGHEYDSAFRLSRNARGYCSQHGFRPLKDGLFLPTWKEWMRDRKARRALRRDS